MSSPSTYREQGSIAAEATDAETVNRVVRDRLSETLLLPIRMAGFWSAVALPFLHVPLLATGLDGGQKTVTFVALLALNLIALYVGYPYQQR